MSRKTAADITIVEYDPSYAAQLAVMWTQSGDSWGGFNVEMTAESIKAEEEFSDSVNCYLAVLGNEVVGYCKVGKWTQDEGALYIETLNVRPDMHGRKIGKALVIKSVERTTELGWGRLDLDTWPGNTKAVSLYKRTGFFWEERDSAVYCVNYIPGILRNELVSDFFETADWYTDSTRPIEVKPDGREENKFTYLTYSWEKDGKGLSMEYARRGRGLRKISRDDYEVEVTVENRDLVFGRDYDVTFRFQNKSGSPLQIGIEGVNDKNITLDFSHSGSVTDSLDVTAKFSVGEIAKDQSEWKTHPRVCARISVNGRAALFAVGIVPKFPAGMYFHDPKVTGFGNGRTTGFLDIESHITADFCFELEDKNGVRFQNPIGPLSLQAGERTSVEIPVTFETSAVYCGRAKAVATLPEGETIEFSREVGGLFLLPGGTYEGERPEGKGEKSAILGIGSHMAALKLERDSHINALSIMAVGRPGAVRFFQFKLGKPYDDEFIRTPPASVDIKDVSNGRQMDVQYKSSTKTGVEVSMHIRVENGGLVRRWFTCKNATDEPLKEELFLNEMFRCDTEDTVLPFDGQVLETRREHSGDFWLWDAKRLSGNWFFSKNANNTIALIWDVQTEVKTGEWYFFAEHNLGILGPGEEKDTSVVTAAVDIFSTWNECRSFALAEEKESVPIEEGLEIRVNGHNPFVGPEYKVEIIEHRLVNLHGSASVTNAGSISFDKKDLQKAAVFVAHTSENDEIDEIDISLDLIPISTRRRRVVFPVRPGDVEITNSPNESFDTLSATNGGLTIRCAPGYAPGLYSCVYRGTEWLDTTFPTLGPRDWWNPWVGGLILYPSNLEARPLLLEKSSASAAECTDTMGNVWQGIRVRVEFTKHDDLKGLIYDQYFMLLPGVPVLAIQAAIHQNTGTYFKDFTLSGDLCPRITDNTTDTVLNYRNREGQTASLTSGHEELSFRPESAVAVTGKDIGQMLLFYADRARTRLKCETQKRSTYIQTRDSVTAAHGTSATIPARFIVFTDSWYADEMLSDLRYIDLLGDIKP